MLGNNCDFVLKIIITKYIKHKTPFEKYNENQKTVEYKDDIELITKGI